MCFLYLVQHPNKDCNTTEETKMNLREKDFWGGLKASVSPSAGTIERRGMMSLSTSIDKTFPPFLHMSNYLLFLNANNNERQV